MNPKSNYNFIKILTICISLILLSLACNKEDPIDPPGEKISTGEIVIEATIGSAGGTLEGGDLLLEVPQGAFTEDRKLSISRYETNTFGSDQLTDVWFVNNLPAEIKKPLKIRLKGLTPEEGFAAMFAETGFAPSLKKQVISYRRHEYTEVDNGIEIELSALQLLKTGPINTQDFDFSAGVVGVANTTEIAGEPDLSVQSPLFRITCPANKLNEAEKLLGYLENAFHVYTSEPRNLSFAGRTRWPMEVTMAYLGISEYGYFSASASGPNGSSLIINASLAENPLELKTTAVHEFMHVYQALRDSRGSFSKAKFEGPNLWIDEAIAVYSEELFVGPDYISAVRSNNEFMPFRGGLDKELSDARYFGYGMSGMMKYLLGYKDPTIISKIYDQLLDGKTPANAIKGAVGQDYKDWWPVFMSYYSRGLIYTDLQPAILQANKSEAFKIESEADSIHKHKRDYDQLQSAVYQLSVTMDNITDLHRLVVKTSPEENVSIVILKQNPDAIEEAGRGISEASTGNLKEIIDDGFSNFYIIVSNLENGSGAAAKRPIETTIRLVASASLKISFVAGCETKTFEKDELISTEYVLNNYKSINIPLTTNGNEMSGAWNNIAEGSSSYPNYHTGTVQLTVNPDNTVSFQLTDFVVTSNNWKISYRLNASNVPKISSKVYEGPVEYVGMYSRRGEFPNGDYILSSGPPFRNIGGQDGYISILLN